MKPGYKQTEIGVIPEEWEVKMLGEFTTIVTGNTPPTNDRSNYGHEFPFVSPADLGEHKYIFNTVKKLSKKGFSTTRRLPQNSVLFVCIGSTIGKCAIAATKLATNQQINAIHPSETFSHEYLFYALLHRASKISIQAGEQAVPLINKSQFSTTLLPLPPLPEQRAIAEVLSDMDALIASLSRLIDKKRALKQAAMQQLLTGQTRLPGCKGEWVRKRLGEILSIQKGQLITSKMLTPGNVPVIAGGKQPAYYHNTANRSGKTITISASGASAGYVALYSQPIFASDCSTISEEDNYSLDFIYQLLLLRQTDIYKRQTGGAQPHIHPRDLTPLPILLPPTIDEQRAIAAVLADMDAEIVALEARLEKTRALKQGAMQELLTGRTRVGKGRGQNAE